MLAFNEHFTEIGPNLAAQITGGPILPCVINLLRYIFI
jgi:hypothetical protein